MEPIISPWFFYFLNCVNNIWGVSLAVAITSGVIALIILITAFCVFADSNMDFGECYKPYSKYFNKAILICIFGTVFTVFIPSKETMIEMAVARNVTEKNVELAKDTVKSMIDYTIESVTKLSDKDDKKDSK